MSKKFSFEELVPVINEAFEKSGEVSVTAKGSEMHPIIREVKDTVTLVKPTEKTKKNDVVLYLSETGEYKLRRIVFVNGATYVASGDNENANEYNITDEQIVGTMVSYDRGGKTHKVTDSGYRLYTALLPVIKPVRTGYKWLKSRIFIFIKFLMKR